MGIWKQSVMSGYSARPLTFITEDYPSCALSGKMHKLFKGVSLLDGARGGFSVILKVGL